MRLKSYITFLNGIVFFCFLLSCPSILSGSDNNQGAVRLTESAGAAMIILTSINDGGYEKGEIVANEILNSALIQLNDSESATNRSIQTICKLAWIIKCKQMARTKLKMDDLEVSAQKVIYDVIGKEVRPINNHEDSSGVNHETETENNGGSRGQDGRGVGIQSRHSSDELQQPPKTGNVSDLPP